MTIERNNHDKELPLADKSVNDQLNLPEDEFGQNKINQIEEQASGTQKNQPISNFNNKNLHHANQNHILNALPLIALQNLSEHLELVHLPVGKMIYESSQELRHAYFPTSCIISLHHILESGRTSELAGVGNEGMVGIALFMGGNTMPSSAVVQITGYAYRLESSILKKEFKTNSVFQQLLLRYTQVLLTQISLTAVCNRHHSLQQQLCRWLLLTLDRLTTNEITMTQELVAGMLGVRREGITEAAGHLQRAGLITYRRGHITVTNRAGLETNVCECYSVLKNELTRLLP